MISIAEAGQSFSLADKVSIYSDKAFRKRSGDFFEAIGNVVIKSGGDTIYGHRATFDRAKGHFAVYGNVRFIGTEYTIYGTSMSYSSESGRLEVNDGKVLAASYHVVARKIIRESRELIIAEEAEFSTCKDCPESWLMYGDRIELTPGQYARISGAILRVRGADILYIPYIIIPVKNERQTGLLFPRFTIRRRDGFSYRQPFFWAIGPYSDATFAPIFWAKRGQGLDTQYRHNIGELSWFEYNSRFIGDEIYQPGGKDRGRFFRHNQTVEHHAQLSHGFFYHVQGHWLRDLDMLSDFPDALGSNAGPPSVGVYGGLEWNTYLTSLVIEGQYKRSLLNQDPLGFDDNLVQVLPHGSFSTTPVSLASWKSMLGGGVDFSLSTRWDTFKQNHPVYRQSAAELAEAGIVDSNGNGAVPDFLFNAQRSISTANVDLKLFKAGAVRVNQEWKGEYRKYNFMRPGQEDFQTGGVQAVTSFSIELEKVFGLAYQREYEREEVEMKKKDEEEVVPSSDRKIISGEDFLSSKEDPDEVVATFNSYRHGQEFRLRHHYLVHEYATGNQLFRNQIRNTRLVFDDRDYLDSEISQRAAGQAGLSIPPLNTIELQWNNVLTRKSPRGRGLLGKNKTINENFSYTQLALFNVSQGLIIDESVQDRPFKEKLTRLRIDSSIALGGWAIGLTESYLHADQAHYTDLSFSKDWEQFSLEGTLTYNVIPSDDNQKLLRWDAEYRPNDHWTLGFNEQRDFVTRRGVSYQLRVDHAPVSECWKASVTYTKAAQDTQIAFDILLNFGDGSGFRGL